MFDDLTATFVEEFSKLNTVLRFTGVVDKETSYIIVNIFVIESYIILLYDTPVSDDLKFKLETKSLGMYLLMEG